jgi:hypothetical protein
MPWASFCFMISMVFSAHCRSKDPSAFSLDYALLAYKGKRSEGIGIDSPKM